MTFLVNQAEFAADFIPKQPEVLVFDCVGFSYQCLFSLVPCPKTMVTRSKQKLARASLSNSQFFKLFGYSKQLSEIFNTESVILVLEMFFQQQDELALESVQEGKS